MSSNKSQYASIEEEMLRLWQEEKTFENSVAQRKGKPIYSFNDGPPFANGLPHFGHSLVTGIKDSMLRYKTMRGYYVPRRNGWDCHGLPVEFAIEKEFGVSGKRQILELGIEKFNNACRDSIFRYKADWETFLMRIGRWSDYQNYYATVDRDYTESVWWVMQQVHQKGLLYRGFKSMPYCPRCETPLSNFEVNEGYRDNVADPSLFVMFELDDEDASLLAWTTTPWSLPGNAALAVKPEAVYVYVEVILDDGKAKTLILAKDRLAVLNVETYKLVKELTGSELIGKSYKPLFNLTNLESHKGHQNLYKVWPAEFVSIEDGSGVLHVAPAFGEDDLSLGQANNFPVLSTVDHGGHIKGGIGFDEVKGKFFKGADSIIIEHLTKAGKVYAAETTHHTYPFCYRCDSPLLYYAINTWFIRVSVIKKEMLKTANEINWIPRHIKPGRFGKWLEGARDWAISRNRYWGAPMPIWANIEDPNDYIVVGSIEELKKLAGDDIKVDDLHRPYIDDISFKKDGKTYQRIEDVIDCWFESGSMPVAQLHYPFENKKEFQEYFPADFIIEGLDQTHLWFYVQHVIATILFNKPAYKNVIVNGIIMAADGKKLSKRLKNYPPTDDVFDNEGADSWRLYLLSSTQATETADYMRFDRRGMLDVQRNILGTLMNSYKFFKLYADIDAWKPAVKLAVPKSDNILDQWILNRLAETIAEITKQADDYKIAHSLEALFVLIDDLSNWYIRRSRRRFWKSEDDSDKQNAYATLHYTLITVNQLLAPWAPFVSDSIYRDLVKDMTMPKSVHLTDWPETQPVDKKLINNMKLVRDYINQGLAQRAAAGIKVRQPLSEVLIPQVPKEIEPIVADELNVKEVKSSPKNKAVKLDTKLSKDLLAEGSIRELVRFIQNARKHANLQVEDRITLRLYTDDKLIASAIDEYQDTIKHETLATEFSISEPKDQDYQETISINDSLIVIAIDKV